MIKENETQEQNSIELSDKELLILAAKSIGIRLEWDGPPDKWEPRYWKGKNYHYWNPLEDLLPL